MVEGPSVVGHRANSDEEECSIIHVVPRSETKSDAYDHASRSWASVFKFTGASVVLLLLTTVTAMTRCTHVSTSSVSTTVPLMTQAMAATAGATTLATTTRSPGVTTSSAKASSTVGATLPSATNYDRLVVVIQSGRRGRDKMVNLSLSTWLKGVKTVVVTRPELHDPAKAIFGIAAFNGTPGRDFTFHLPQQNYWGANRMLEGIKIANATYQGQFDWVMCIDDDNYISLRTLWPGLAALDQRRPYFIGQRQGGGGCQAGPNDKRKNQFDCCGDLSSPCRVHRSRSELQTYANGKVTTCHQNSDMAKNHPYICCPVVPSKGSMKYSGFPYQYSPDGVPFISGTATWPYGGTGYALSSGLLGSISKGDWQQCIDKLVCGNADMMVGNCLFHYGYSFSAPSWHMHAMKHWVLDEKSMRQIMEKDAMGKDPWTCTGLGGPA
mmetsp:Transcript_82304/g.233112  ORF Transcript_82304/g.233112 Transcript_82304/m.233112 type:complete len:438 (+) Transcript_82304:58-1371(+)